jgi:hypothetical protein
MPGNGKGKGNGNGKGKGNGNGWNNWKAPRRPKNGRRRGQRVGTGMRTYAPNVLAQGVGAVTTRPFGSTPGVDLRVWDAKMPMHLPLPRAIGPYLVMRTTRRFSSANRCLIFGTFKQAAPSKVHSADGGGWSSICCAHDVNMAANISAANNTLFKTMPMTGLGPACTLVPSALSVQIMNPNPLSTTEGIVYAGVMNTQAKVAGRAEHWGDYFDKFVEFQTPRLLSAGKLALRGVQINSYPLNMTPLSDFTQLNHVADKIDTWAYPDNELEPTGFAPIMVYNTGQNLLDLEYLVTIEWRTRFDLDHPASSAHKQHPIASDATWANLMTKASNFGNGVIDIADTISNVGKVVNQYTKAAGMESAIIPLA